MDRFGLKWIALDKNRPKWTKWTEVDHSRPNGPKWAEFDQIDQIRWNGHKCKAKIQNSLSKFHHFSLQFSKYAFCHFNLLNFNFPQFSPPLTFHPVQNKVLALI